MAVIAIAGGNGNVAPHIIDALIARNRHKIIILSRRIQSPPLPPGIAEHKCVDYQDLAGLAAALSGVDIVLSFILPFADKDNVAQKSLIDACITAGVRRFAPSEWALYDPPTAYAVGHSSTNSANPFYRMRNDVRRYLESVNDTQLRLEYTCFQPGLFLDYFTFPAQSARHLKITQHYIDFETRQAILVGKGDQPVTFTLIDDLARVVAEAVDYEGVWPADGGVAGWQTTPAEIVRIGERLRGGETFTIHRVTRADLDAGNLTSPWCPVLAHPSIPEEQLETMSRKINLQALKGIAHGEWVVGEDWNHLLPAFKFTDPLEFLTKWWAA